MDASPTNQNVTFRRALEMPAANRIMAFFASKNAVSELDNRRVRSWPYQKDVSHRRSKGCEGAMTFWSLPRSIFARSAS